MEFPLSATSLLPSLFAIILALVTRQVFISMFLGIWVGAWLIEGPSLLTLLTSWLHVVDTYLVQAIVPKDGDTEHFSIVLFSLITGGMIGVISRNGGTTGIVRRLTRYANTPKKAQGATVALGGLIFFDDYANTLIVGNTMRPLTDTMKISREKLAFLVDSTAAPIACIALITTWVGFQVSLLNDALKQTPISETSGFELMLGSIVYSYYPILMLVFIVFLIATGRDFGAMRRAERQAQTAPPKASKTLTSHDGDDMISELDVEPLAANALVPILLYIAATLGGLIDTGTGSTLRDILGTADPFISVLWGSLTGLTAAIIMSLVTRRLSVSQCMLAMENGLQPMLIAAMILTFAWAIADINTELRTAEYIVSFLGDSLDPRWLPVIIFCIAGATSFATGSSWGTMGILVPLVLPLALATLQSSGAMQIEQHPILFATIASVLTGAVWGDHCSPISDTTILSSMASGCNHIAHVRTQTPYALAVAIIGMMCGLIPVGFGMPWWIGIFTGSVLLYLTIRLYGTTHECDNQRQH